MKALRSLMRMKATAVVVLLTLAVGIAANLVVFALVNAALLRPLPFAEPERLVALDDQVGGKSAGVSWGEVQELERAPGLFEGVAAYSKRTWGLTDHSGSGMDVVLSGMVTPGFFRVLRAEPVVGTTLDGAEGDEHVAVLSYEFWQRRYRGDGAIVGQSLALNDVVYRVAGVLPKTMEFAIGGEAPDVYIPLSWKDYCCRVDARGLDGVARLGAGVSVAAANEHLKVLAEGEAKGEGLRGLRYAAIPLKSFLAKDERKTLLFLWLAVAVLGVIAALNAGAVLLARSLRNLRQYAVKISLGATVRHLVVEQAMQAVVLACGASAVAVGLSYAALRGLRATALFAPFLERVSRVESLWDWRVFAFCAALSLIAAMAASLLPLVLLRRLSADQILRSHAGMSSSRAGRQLRTGLIVAQLALSVMLVSSATSFGHSLYTLLGRNPGYRTRNVVMAGIGVPEARYDTDAKMIAFHEQVLESIRTIPGVRGAGFAAGAPIHPLSTRFLMDGAEMPVAQRPRVDVALVSPEMFGILDLTLVRGRNFGADDRVDEALVMVVNQAFARAYLDMADPLARGMRVGFYNGESMKPWSHFDVVGIVADSRNRALDRAPEPEVYLSTQQVALEGGEYFLDTTRDAAALQEELPTAVWRVDPLVQKVEPIGLQGFIEKGFADKRVTLFLFLGFAGVALGLASTGLGASISASVSESTKEIGIRSALGESRRSLGLRVLRGSVLRTLVGTAVGVGGSVGLSRVASLRLDSRMVVDGAALGLDAVLMLVIAVVVSLVPVSRALRVSPVEALRAE